MDIRKEDIKTLEDIFFRYKKSLSSKDLEKKDIQEILMFGEEALDNLKESYKNQFDEQRLFNTKKYAKFYALT